MDMLNNREQVTEGVTADEAQKPSVQDSVISVSSDEAVVKAALEGAAAVIHAQQQPQVPLSPPSAPAPVPAPAPPAPAPPPAPQGGVHGGGMNFHFGGGAPGAPAPPGGPKQNNVNWTLIIIVGMILAAFIVGVAIVSDISSKTLDDDGDGVANANDRCSNTPSGNPVDSNGCAAAQKDSDDDGISDADDLCPETPPGSEVDYQGCTYSNSTPGIALTSTLFVLGVVAFIVRRKS